jgi:hypothetical protein
MDCRSVAAGRDWLTFTLNYGTEPNVYAAVATLLGFNLTVLGATGLLYRALTKREAGDAATTVVVA